MILVARAPAFMTVQDAGFRGFRASGIPPGGAMDRSAWMRGNSLVGNRDGEAALEWAVSGGALRFETPSRIALTGARCVATLGGVEVRHGAAVEVEAGTELLVEKLTGGRFLYVSVAGGIDVPVVMGSRSTYLPGKFGGFEGRRIRNGDRLRIGSAGSSSALDAGAITAGGPPSSPSAGSAIRVVPGPEESWFDPVTLGTFYQSEFTVSASSDRAGYRLEGTRIAPANRGTLVSQPGCPGAIQIPAGGSPIVLMADGPTIGGYARIAVVATADLATLAQMPPGAKLTFVKVGFAEAVGLLGGGAGHA